MNIRPSITREPWDLRCVDLYVCCAVETQGHVFAPNEHALDVWSCARCGAPWIVDPDRNPASQIRRDAPTMPWCPEGP